jgi:peptide subunit release factor 1 (eRF1)
MITRENIGELARFESPEGCALSFYYQPSAPQNKSHREEAILVKDLVRQALHEAEGAGRNGCTRDDLNRILDLAEHLHGNGGRAKAIFACGSQNFWREFDLPPRLAQTRIFINRAFHLRPLTAIADVLPRFAIVLADKTKARFFTLFMDEIRETEGFVNKLPRRGRSDGFVGYDAGHAERHVENEARRHYQAVAEHLKDLKERAEYDKLVIGIRDENWPELEAELHTYVRQHVLGHFPIDPGTATPPQVREHAERVIAEFRKNRRENLMREAVGEAHRNGRGALGIRRVLRSLETGEVQTLLLSRDFVAPAVECRNCGHIDINDEHTKCSVCEGETRRVDDVADALLVKAVRNNIEILHVPPSDDFAKIGNVAALLRFRADQNTQAKLAS